MVSWRVRTETVSQLINIVAFVQYLRYVYDGQEVISYTVHALEIVIFIRLLRILALLYELAVWRVIIETMQGLLGPFYTLLLVQYTVFYLFAVLGMRLFGGAVYVGNTALEQNAGVPPLYVLDNFNDFLSSMVTLFDLMVVNNWQVNVLVFTTAKGDNDYRIFFILFYYFSVVIGLNIVVAFAIDMYTSIDRLHQEHKERMEKLMRKVDVRRRSSVGGTRSDEENGGGTGLQQPLVRRGPEETKRHTETPFRPGIND